MNSDFAIALHALVYLDHRNQPLASQVLAANICTNAVRVRNVMRALTHAHIVDSKAGIEGGYTLAQPASTISLRDIAQALHTDFINANWLPGDMTLDCRVSQSMSGVIAGLSQALNTACYNKLTQITVRDITQRLFSPDQAILDPQGQQDHPLIPRETIEDKHVIQQRVQQIESVFATIIA